MRELGPTGMYYNKDGTEATREEWVAMFEDAETRKVALSEVSVSTVFMGMDHRFGGDGPPILWETMIFGGPHDGYQQRYSSVTAAIEGHAYAAALALGLEYEVKHAEVIFGEEE